jgi:hypothetical protein
MQGSWSVWDLNWAWSILLIAVTIAIHATGIIFIARGTARYWSEAASPAGNFVDTTAGAILAIITVTLALAALHAIESGVWAFAYVHLGAISSPADASLYSLDSMTTRGAAGLVLAPQWRMLGAIESANGLLLFGISTAFLFAIMARLLRGRLRPGADDARINQGVAAPQIRH